MVFRSPSLATACCVCVYVLPLLKRTPPPPPLHVRRRCLWNQAHMGEVSRSFTKEELCGLDLPIYGTDISCQIMSQFIPDQYELWLCFCFNKNL